MSSQAILKLVGKNEGEKQRALEAALAQIDRAFGKGSVMTLGKNGKIADIEAVSTGSLGLDMALGIGGLPKGRVIEIYGPESSGKTTLAQHTVAEIQKQGGTAAFVDTVAPGQPLLDTFLQTVELLRDPSHVRDYSRAEWLTLIGRAGLNAGRAGEHRVRLEMKSWLERMRTPPVQADAIRALEAVMSQSVTQHFAIEADGSFTIDVLTVVATKP